MRKGFTLLEMLIVVVIISILASTAFMYYERFMERMRIAEADTIIGAAILSQERVYVRFQHYTTYWHKLDAVPVAVRKPKEQNDFANGEENTIYYTRGGMLSGEPRNGFAISFEKNERYMKQPAYDTPMEALKAMLAGRMKFNVWNINFFIALPRKTSS